MTPQPRTLWKLLSAGLVILFCGQLLFGVEEPGPTIGKINSKDHSYSVVFEFGMEVSDDGKVRDYHREMWLLLCNYPSSGGNKTACYLTETLFIKSPRSSRADVTTDFYDNIKIKQADWKAGKLDFSFVAFDRSTTDVEIRMTYDIYAFIHLKSFRAVNVGKNFASDKLTVTEYKIPAHTYTINYPIVFRGLE
jgi:hypothetical protein